MSKGTDSMVALSGSSYYYFVKISICDAFSQFNDDACKVNVLRLSSRNKNN